MIPVDSADVAEQRELQQARAAAEADAVRMHESYCVTGWVGEDTQGRPVPCPCCRPRLLEVACWTCGVRYAGCALQQGRRRGPCCNYCNHSRHHQTGGPGVNVATPRRLAAQSSEGGEDMTSRPQTRLRPALHPDPSTTTTERNHR